jgi:hypothetical protein
MNEQEMLETISMLLKLIDQYVEENPLLITEKNFEENLIDYLKDLLCCDDDNADENVYENTTTTTTSTSKIIIDETYCNDVELNIKYALELAYEQLFPCRSYDTTFVIPKSQEEIEKITHSLSIFSNSNGNEQKTKEWYNNRHQMLTGSTGYKCFGSQSVVNQIIYEKCNPVRNKFNSTNIKLPMHWGEKYEKVSAMYYEYNYETTLSYYDCINHAKHNFIGASPDGINADIMSNRYGRMVEIKNIFNREIDGIPSKEYWIQMQWQMETCELNECDFLETRFIEYETEYDFYNDYCEDEGIIYTKNYEFKGIILHFVSNDDIYQKPIYIYKPLLMNIISYNKWFEEQKREQQILGNNLVKIDYWRLDEVSCVLVLRNERWWNANFETIKKVWDTILIERETGYLHRAPKPRPEKLLIKLPASIVVNKLDYEKTDN